MWRRPLDGVGAMALAGDTLYTTGLTIEPDTVMGGPAALDAATGAVK